MGVGFLYVGNGHFRSQRNRHLRLPLAMLKALAKTRFGEVTFTCAPPGSGESMCQDRDAGSDEEDDD
jgi:hypothetical protein